MKCNGFQLFVVGGAVVISLHLAGWAKRRHIDSTYKMHIQKHYRCDQDAIGHTQNSLKHTSNIMAVMLVIFLCESRWWVWCLAGSLVCQPLCAQRFYFESPSFTRTNPINSGHTNRIDKRKRCHAAKSYCLPQLVIRPNTRAARVQKMRAIGRYKKLLCVLVCVRCSHNFNKWKKNETNRIGKNEHSTSIVVSVRTTTILYAQEKSFRAVCMRIKC